MTVDNGPDEIRPKKRGRKPLVDTSKSDSEMEVDQPQPQAKKPRRSQTKKSQTEISEEHIVGSMATFMHLDDWEGLVSSVDTVERESDNSLSVYFTL
jgi:chromobox protein 5